MRFRRQPEAAKVVVDTTAWIIDHSLAEFLLLSTHGINYMALLGYTYMNGVKLYPYLPKDASLAYRFVAMFLQCTGGGILVPLMIGSIPVPLEHDAYPIAILLAFLLHEYYPILREVVHLSLYLETAVVVLYEIYRASVLCKLTGQAGKAISPSEFSLAIFGPIICGTIAGCGGAFVPLSKGLDPIKTGLAQPMWTALVAATLYHLFVHTSLSKGWVNASKKAQFFIACFFVTVHLYSTYFPSGHAKKHEVKPAVAPKLEKKD